MEKIELLFLNCFWASVIQTATQTMATTTQQINGSNGFKKIVEEYGTLIEQMKLQFEDDLYHPTAMVEHVPVCRPLHDFHVRLCGVAHRDFIRTTCESSELVRAQRNLAETLATLEKLRKMFVNNKQQRKTEHTQLSRALCEIRDILTKENGEGLCLEYVPEHTSIMRLNQMDANVKQHHRTVARNILEVARTTHSQLLRFIMVFQIALDDAAGAINYHAEKCRTRNERTTHLAMVEFCVSLWWFQEHEDMDPDDYFVGAEYDDAHSIQIQVNPIGALPPTPAVCSMEFDDALSQLVLTPESMDAFELEQKRLLHEQQAANERQQQYEKELVEYYLQLSAK